MSSQALTLSISKPAQKWFPYSIMKKKKKKHRLRTRRSFVCARGKKNTEHIQTDEILTH